jgi:crotonobetainyl-CoA:carnitine CoA-transferase CaiB-like acyl-CoA transferase
MMADAEKLEDLTQKLGYVEEVVVDFLRRHPKQYIYEEGQKRRLLVGMVSTPEDISRSPQLAARDWFVEIDDPGRRRRLRYPGPPWQFKATPATLRRPAPLLGEHNEELFGEIGLEPALVGALARAGVV